MMTNMMTVDAELARWILDGDADVVNRDHPTEYRGRTSIHDGEKTLGMAEVIGCHPWTECSESDADGRLCSGWAAVGSFHWVLANPRTLRIVQ